jgi:hypothetical protein
MGSPLPLASLPRMASQAGSVDYIGPIPRSMSETERQLLAERGHERWVPDETYGPFSN